MSSLPKWVVGDMSDLPPTATEKRTLRDVSNVPNTEVSALSDYMAALAINR
jgi:hypothetical protein